MRKVLLTILMSALYVLYTHAADIVSTATGGLWTSATTWVGGVLPAAGDNVSIVSGSTVILNQDISITNLTIDGTLIIGNDLSERNLIITGTTDIGSVGVLNTGNFDITNNITFQGNITNDGVFDLYESSSKVTNAIFSGTFNLSGSNSLQFAKITFQTGTITTNVALDINGAVVIENAAVFANGDLTHTVSGNWTENGSGQMTGNGTIEMDAQYIQSVTSASVFYNLTYKGGGSAVLGAAVTVNNDFLVTSNTTVQTSQYHTFGGDFVVADGSKYDASAGRATFNASAQSQNIQSGTSSGAINIKFNEIYLDNGGAAFPKTFVGNHDVYSTFYVYDDAVVNDMATNQTLRGNAYILGSCNFSGILNLRGGTYYDNGDYNFSLGTANINILGYVYIADNTTMHVDGDISITPDENGNHIGLIINNNATLEGNGTNRLTVADNSSLYIRGSNNFPTTFDEVSLSTESYVRYDASLADQSIYPSVNYGRLYLSAGTSKTAAGDLVILSHLYLYNSTNFKLLAYNVTVGGDVVNSTESYGNASITATGGTFSFNASDRNQSISNGGTGTYTFYNLSISQSSLTTNRYNNIQDNIIVLGSFSATNPAGSNTKRLYINLYENTITGSSGSGFSLGENVWLLTQGTNTFQTTMQSFDGTKTLHANSTIRFNRGVVGSSQTIPNGFTYGNIELEGSNDKTPQGTLNIDGSVSAVGGTPVLKTNNYTISVAGNWNMSLATTNLTGLNTVTFDGVNQTISQSNFCSVSFSGTGIKTIVGTLDILKNLTINNGVSIVTDDNYIYIEGNWMELGSGNFKQNGGMVSFDGTTSNQTISANNSSYFYHFTINKSGSNKTVTLNTKIDINGNIDFVQNNAVLNLNAKNLYVAGDFYFRAGCTFTHNNGKVFFDGTSLAQLIRNYSLSNIVFKDAEFTGTAVKRLYDYSFKFQGDVTISNTTLDGQGWDHYVEGNWLNNGIFRHSATLHFNGARDQSISQSTFNAVNFGGGNFVKTLTGDITLTGNLRIQDATLDVSPSSYSITMDNNWYNDSTGSFICRQGTVYINGDYSYLFTGESSTQYGTGNYLTTEGGTKSFYNLTITKNTRDNWILQRGDLHVLNHFTINQGDYRQSNDYSNFGINNIYVGGDFISKGQFRDNNVGNAFIELSPLAGSFVFDPGSSNSYTILRFNGAAGSTYTFESDLNLYNNRALTIENGIIDLNKKKIITNGVDGDIFLNGGTLEVDESAILSLGSGATFTNAGGIFKLVGIAGQPANLMATTGNFVFVQTLGTMHAQNYRIENTSGNGIQISGGNIDATNTFQNGSFSHGTGTAYFTLSGIDLGGDRNLAEVSFNIGPTYNVQRTTGNGALTFQNAIGTLAGEDYDNDDANPGTLINWTYPGAAYWDGDSDGDGDNISWNDPNNWSNDAVPNSTSTVILDHTIVGISYNVSLNSGANGQVLRLIIISGANAVSLTLDGKELDIEGDITIGTNSVLTQTTALDTIRVGGSWANEGTFNEGLASVIFNPASGTHTITTKGITDPFYDFIIRGTSATNVLSSTLAVSGNVSLEGGILYAGNYTINLAGNWTRTGGAVFNFGTGLVDFNNSGDQTINGGEFYNLTFSGSGTKNITANLDIDNDITIGAGTVFDGATYFVFVGDDWTNNAGNTGFVQTGNGTVVFDGISNGQDIGTTVSLETTFNNISFSGNQTKYTRKTINVNGSLQITSAALYIVDGTFINGVGGSNTLNMSNGRLYINGNNNFPQGFETINLAGGVVDYYADIDQIIYPTNYYSVLVRRITSAINTTKTLGGNITIAGGLTIYDVETLLDVNDYTITLFGGLDFPAGGRQIDWRADGTLIHNGEGWTIDPDINYFNNVIKKNRGSMNVRYKSLEFKGNLFITEDASFVQDTVNVFCSGTGKTFSLASTTYMYSYNPTTLGSSSGRKAFPTGFANYDLHKDSRVYLAGTAHQTILSTPVYGNLYLYTHSQINFTLDGNLVLNGSFGMYDEPTLIDAGYNLSFGGATVDIKKYTPTGNTIMTFFGADQRIYDSGPGATSFDMKNIVFSGSGTKSLHYNGDDYYVVSGNLTINAGVTLYIPRRLDFSGTNWINNGVFNHTDYVVSFIGNLAQSIDPGTSNDFYAVSFSNSGTKEFVNHGINVNNGTFVVDAGTVNMGNLTHNIASERITINGGTWSTENASFIFDRNGTQYLPNIFCQNITLRRYDQWDRARFLEGDIVVNDLTVEEGNVLYCAANSLAATTKYNATITGNYNNQGTMYAYGNAFFFESIDNNPKTITQGNGSFDYVYFNASQINERTYTLTQETRIYEDLNIGQLATLDLNGQILRLGNDDSNDPVEPAVEQHTIQWGGVLEVDAGASLIFSCRDLGNPSLNVDGTLKIVGELGNNATITSTDWYANDRRIDININDGAFVHAQYYLLKYLSNEGFYVDAGATIDATNNFSNGTWSDLNTAGGTYFYCNAPSAGLGTINNLTFNYSATPAAGTHFNIRRDAGSSGILAVGGNIGGLLSGLTYEADPTGENSTGTSLISWPPVTDIYWTGTESADWFNANNWSPAQVPDNLTNAIIPIRTNNPLINGQNAMCKDLKITDGFLTLQGGYDLTVSGDVYLASGTSVGILALEDPGCNISVNGNWTRGQNGLFSHGNGTVIFSATGGSISIDARDSHFGNLTFNGDATFMINRAETFVDGNFTISNGTVQPISNNYLLHIKGNYANPGGVYDNTITGTVYFDGNGDQIIDNIDLWNIVVNGAGNKSFTTSAIVNGNLVVKNATLTGACNMQLIGNVTIESTASFADGNFTHNFVGTRWIGAGAYFGNGTVKFTREGTQYIASSSFNNISLENLGGVALEGDMNITGNFSVIAPNSSLNLQTYQITNTSGTGTFSLADSRYLYVRGANNFPAGFNLYDLHKNSYVLYDGTVAQFIAPVPVSYGRLYLDNSAKTLVGNIDVNSILYFYDDASLDVTASNYRINIEGSWYNQYGAYFYQHEGEVVFDGNEAAVYMYIYEASKDRNQFYKLTVNKGAGIVYCNYTDITVFNNLRVLNGSFSQSQTMTVGGDMSALSGTFGASGTYYLNKASGTSNLQLNNSILNNLVINSGATYVLQDNLQIYGQFTLMAGIFNGNGQTMSLGNYGEVHEISGTLKLGMGGKLKLPDFSTLKVNSGGEIWVVGDETNAATVTNNGGRYYFNIESGGTIRARFYLFEYMAENGIYIKDGGIIHNDYNFSYGTFTNSAYGGTCLRIENNQSFTEAGANAITNVSFPFNPLGGASNITKTITSAGTLDMKDYSGALAGENYDNDPENLINWISPPIVLWTGNVNNDWYTIGNWQVSSGPDRYPEITDNVVIEKKTNQPIITTDGAVAKTVEVQANAILTLQSAAPTDTTLKVVEDFYNAGTVIMSTGADTLAVGGNWRNTGSFVAGTGTVIMNSVSGIKSIDNLYDPFYNLYINTVSDIQLLRNLTINKHFVVLNGNFDLASDARILTVKGDFINYDNFIARSAKVTFAGISGTQSIYPGSAVFYNIDIDAGSAANVQITDNNLFINHNLNINSGNFVLNGKNLYIGDGNGIDALTVNGGLFYVDANATLRMANLSTIEVNAGGTMFLVGTDVDNPAYLQSQTGTYSFNVNSGATLGARYYNIQHVNANGVRFKNGSSLHTTNNFSDGVWRNGTSGGQYLWFENNFASDTTKISGVYFHSGATYNAKRLSGTGVVAFLDALGLLAGYQFEEDIPDNSLDDGFVVWQYQNSMYVWTGAVSNDWNIAANWDVPVAVDPSGHAVPNSLGIASIPDVSFASNRFPILGVAPTDDDGTCFDLLIENGASLTIANNKNLDADNAITVYFGASLIISNGSASQINVGDTWSMDGTFSHGGNSTVVFDAPAGKLLTIAGNASFYNFTINSAGAAEYMSGGKLRIDNHFVVTQGIFTVSNATDTLFVAGDFIADGTFNHGNSVAQLNGTNQNISLATSNSFYRLNCLGTNTKTLTSDIAIENDFFILAGVTVGGSAYSISLKGDWINRGLFSPGTGTVEFIGNNTQIIDNYGTENFYNFSVNNSSSTFPQIVLYGDLVLGGNSWAMLDGIVETTADEMLYVGDLVALSGGNSANSYVNGPMSKSGSANFVFPVGKDLKFARLGISGMSVVGTFLVEYFEAAYSDLSNIASGLDHVSGYEHWTIQRTAGLAEPVVSLYWTNGEESGIDNLVTLTTAVYNTGEWQNTGNGVTTGTTAAGSISSGAPIAIFGPITFGSLNEDNPLHGYTRWTGQFSQVWNYLHNWTAGIPSASLDAVIPAIPANQPIIDNTAVVRKLTIDDGASLNIEPMQSLTLKGKLVVNGDLRLNSSDLGNAVLLNENTITYGINSHVITELFLEAGQFKYIASPTTQSQSDIIKSDPFSPYYNHNLFSYYEPGNTYNMLEEDWIELNGILEPVTGYAFYGDKNITVEFMRDAVNENNFNTGDKSKTLYYTGSTEAEVLKRGWNFVGNPYPANLDWDAVGWSKSNIYNSIYFWNGTNYSYYVSSGLAQDGGIGVNNATNIIPAEQGFFLKVIEGGDPDQNQVGTLIIPASARTVNSHAFYKKTSNSYTDIFKISVTCSNGTDETAIRFLDGTSVGFDNDFDAFKIFPDKEMHKTPQLFSVNNKNVPIAINSLPLLNEDMVILLGFRAVENGNFSLTVEPFELQANYTAYLEDRFTQTTTELLDLKYDFFSEEGTFNNRFVIKFKKEPFDPSKYVSEMPDIYVYTDNSFLYLSSETPDAIVGQVRIYNMVGKLVDKFENNEWYLAKRAINFEPGAYLVNIQSVYGRYSERIVIIK